MLDETSSHVLIEYSIDLVGSDGVSAVGAGGDECAVRGDGDLERDKGAITKVGFGRGEDIRELVNDVGQGPDDWWRPASTV